MKLLVLCAFLAVVAAAPQDIDIIKYNVNNDGLGAYNFEYEQSDGTKFDQTGEVRNPGSEKEFVVVKGSYSWIAPDGHAYLIEYVADENGFQPTISQGYADSISPKVLALLRE
ncbi:unnamed protein product [Spodoptera exigua]|nr:unnamed protein product [Spodoptera exigua]